MGQVLDDMYEPLQAMGFEILQAFEEITNSPENVRLSNNIF
jgi:beta-N-acetylhexosaminidase